MERAFFCSANQQFCISGGRANQKFMPAKGASMKRFSILIALLCASSFAMAQKADVTFTVGGSFVSDSQQTFSTGPSSITKLKTDNHIFLEGTLGVRMLNAKVAALYVELPVAGLPSQKLSFTTSPSTLVDHISTMFITSS